MKSWIIIILVILTSIIPSITQALSLDVVSDKEIEAIKFLENYRWSSFNENKKLDYGYSSRVRVNNNIIKINKQINFPVSLINDENLMYIEPTEYIDITPQIKDKANEIVKGQDDLFEATVRLAEWTRTNVRYDLSTLTESVVQKSSWVLAAREGVCDEITNLFVSFLRSLHIPTRYVSGMAYSSAINGFGPHAWAEVYFPNYGWVPFDVTFGQYGWIDPGHVKMIESKDAKEPSVTYNWRSIDVQIADKNFNVSASLANKGENIKPLLTHLYRKGFDTIVLSNIDEKLLVKIKAIVKDLLLFSFIFIYEFIIL